MEYLNGSKTTDENYVSGTDFYGGTAEALAGTGAILTAAMISSSTASSYLVQYKEVSMPLLVTGGIFAILDGSRRFSRAVEMLEPDE